MENYSILYSGMVRQKDVRGTTAYYIDLMLSRVADVFRYENMNFQIMIEEKEPWYTLEIDTEYEVYNGYAYSYLLEQYNNDLQALFDDMKTEGFDSVVAFMNYHFNSCVENIIEGYTLYELLELFDGDEELQEWLEENDLL